MAYLGEWRSGHVQLGLRMNRLYLANLSCEWDWARAWQRDRGVEVEPHPGGEASERGHRADRRELPGLPGGLERARQKEADFRTVWRGVMTSCDRVVTAGERSADSGGGHSRIESGNPVPEWRAGGRATAEMATEDRERGPTELIAWGATESAVELAGVLGACWRGTHPELAMRFNQRSVRYTMEVELGLALPGSALINSRGDLERALEAGFPNQAGWILKGNFGMSGREAIRGRGARLTAPQSGFCESRLRQTGPLVLEPQLAPLEEIGVLWEIPRGGRPELLGVSRQWIVAGSWRGCQFFDSQHQPGHWEEAIAKSESVAVRVARDGYWGPLGVDAMWHRDAQGGIGLRVLQDLNARWTMGRMGLAWWARFGRSRSGAWIWGRLSPTERESGLVGSLADWLGKGWRVTETVVTSEDIPLAAMEVGCIGSVFARLEPSAE